jgi:hypothetical protein
VASHSACSNWSKTDLTPSIFITEKTGQRDRAAFQEDADFGQAHQALLKALEKAAQFI